MINLPNSNSLNRDPDDDIEIFLAQDRMTIPISRNINKLQSNFIFDRVKENKEGVQINWPNVMRNFECPDSSPKNLEKKIRNHYYNRRAKEKQNKIRKMKRIIRKLSTLKFKLAEKAAKMNSKNSGS